MKTNNSFLLGMLLGIIFPTIAYVLTNYTDAIRSIMPGKPAGLYILATAVNMVGVWIAYRKGRGELGKGVVLATFLAMLLAVFSKAVII